MKSHHRTEIGDARTLPLAEESIDLVVTSPPYPMIEMWDGVFAQLASGSRETLARGDGWAAFETMHEELDRVWEGVHRVLRPGGFACINIGDATRTLDGEFCLYPNHARIVEAARRIGFTTLPDILWRKQTNAPNKFMGSGMLPAGAYVTYEHEYVLVLRKGGKRIFATAQEKKLRRESAFFWEERNVWFSDVWADLKGTRQSLADPATRARSGAFPFELAFRLIQMFSLYGDTVLDPFLGTGTTSVAAAASGRNSFGVEIDEGLARASAESIAAAVVVGRERAQERLAAHAEFVRRRLDENRPPKHQNVHYGFPVVTRQEVDLVLCAASSLHTATPEEIVVEHEVVLPEKRPHQAEWTFS